MRFIFIIFFIPKLIFAQNLSVSPQLYDFGTVKEWNNPKAEFKITNNTGKAFIFLPISYNQDIQVILPKESILPGQTADISVIYFSSENGSFKKNIKIYVSTLAEPLEIQIKGHIKSFSPDALMSCPTLGQTAEKEKIKPVIINVIDAQSKKGIRGFNVLLSSPLEQFLIEIAPKDYVEFENIKNEKYRVIISCGGYIEKNEEISITRNKRNFTIELDKDPNVKDFSESKPKDSNDQIKIDKPKKDEMVEIEKIRKYFDDKFKDKKVIEKDVLVVQDQNTDSSKIEIEDISEQSDFGEDGKLNIKKYALNNIVFLIDISGSMANPEKLPYMKEAMKEMIKYMRKEDKITLITYASKITIELDGIGGDKQTEMFAIIDKLVAQGRSSGTEGLQMAYEKAHEQFILGGNNQIFLVTDGIFNSENFKPKQLYKKSKEQADKGLKLSTIGFGKNKEAILFLSTLAQNGNGHFIQIQKTEDIQTKLISEIMQQSGKK